MKKIEEHWQFLRDSGKLEEKRRRRVRDRLRRKLQMRLMQEFWSPDRQRRFEEAADRVLRGEISYNEALAEIEKGFTNH